MANPSADEWFKQMEEAGVDQQFIEQGRRIIDPSPIRAERDEAKAERDRIAQENEKLRSAVLSTTWKELGATGDPSAIRFPDDVDITDPTSLREYAVSKGFAQAPPDSSAEELAGHERVNRATVGDMPSAADARQKLLSTPMTEDEFWAQAAQLESRPT